MTTAAEERLAVALVMVLAFLAALFGWLWFLGTTSPPLIILMSDSMMLKDAAAITTQGVK